jgi:hypothetical protein
VHLCNAILQITIVIGAKLTRVRAVKAWGEEVGYACAFEVRFFVPLESTLRVLGTYTQARKS